jgi:hypothetical protein
VVKGFTRTFSNKHASFRAVLGDRGYMALKTVGNDSAPEIRNRLKMLATKTLFQEKRRLRGMDDGPGYQWNGREATMGSLTKISNSLDYHMNSNMSVTMKSNPMPYGVAGSRGGKLAAIYEDGVRAFDMLGTDRRHPGFQATNSFKIMRAYMFERMNIEVLAPAMTAALMKGRAQESFSVKAAQVRGMRKNQMADYKQNRRMSKPVQKNIQIDYTERQSERFM